jgi:uncharacterized protein
MTLLRAQSIGIPLPRPTSISKTFWEGCRRGELLYQVCSNEHIIFAPAPRCRICLTDEFRWERSLGKGYVYSWSMVWRPQTPAFQTPYAPAIIELDEGFRMMSNIIGCDHTEMRAGMRVTAEYHAVGEDMYLVYFSPEKQSTSAS